VRTFKNQAAQGDLLFARIEALPAGVVEVAPVGDRCIVGHSETGHHHVLDRAHVRMYRLPESIYECFVVVDEATPLEHLRQHDTHAPIMVPPGTYRVHRQRERAYVPEGFRRVED
jgi:hypothetical protein